MYINAGQYLIVDPSYRVKGADWAELLKQLERFQSDLSLGCLYGEPVLIWATIGDCSLPIRVGRRKVGEVRVDSGTLALVPGVVAMHPQAEAEIQKVLREQLVWFGMIASGPVRRTARLMKIGDLSIPTC